MKTKTKQAALVRWHRLYQALERDQKLTAYDFNEMVIIAHQDGSCYSIVEAKTKLEKEYLIVYQEHGHPLVFHRSDLSTFTIVDRKKLKPIEPKIKRK